MDRPAIGRAGATDEEVVPMPVSNDDNWVHELIAMTRPGVEINLFRRGLADRSIQEAVSAGIPVLATDVGGVSEIVGSDNGMLLRPDPGLDEVVAALERLTIVDPPERRLARRLASRARWARDFDAERNHTCFAHRLRELMKSL